MRIRIPSRSAQRTRQPRAVDPGPVAGAGVLEQRPRRPRCARACARRSDRRAGASSPASARSRRPRRAARASPPASTSSSGASDRPSGAPQLPQKPAPRVTWRRHSGHSTAGLLRGQRLERRVVAAELERALVLRAGERQPDQLAGGRAAGSRRRAPRRARRRPAGRSPCRRARRAAWRRRAAGCRACRAPGRYVPSLEMTTAATCLPSGEITASSTPWPGLVTSVAKPLLCQSSGSAENGRLLRKRTIPSSLASRLLAEHQQRLAVEAPVHLAAEQRRRTSPCSAVVMPSASIAPKQSDALRVGERRAAAVLDHRERADVGRRRPGEVAEALALLGQRLRARVGVLEVAEEHLAVAGVGDPAAVGAPARVLLHLRSPWRSGRGSCPWRRSRAGCRGRCRTPARGSRPRRTASPRSRPRPPCRASGRRGRSRPSRPPRGTS